MMKEYWVAVAKAVQDEPEFEPMLQDIRSPPYDHEHLLGLVREAFGNADSQVVASALEFPSAEPVLHYFDSMRTMHPISDAAWERGRARLEAVLNTYTWPWPVSKGIALVTAMKPD
ncbi:MAG: hypothetical protein C4332_07420 [Meiothermus sp.]